MPELQQASLEARKLYGISEVLANQVHTVVQEFPEASDNGPQYCEHLSR